MTDKIEYTVLKSEFESSGCDTLLDYMEQQSLKVHFHCRDGFCGACRTPLKSGDINYEKEPLAFVRRGDFLPCCSKPCTDIKIEAEKDTD
ncbi:2Fe-2S iron-sulfur cluster binding domain-containing protein [Catenovulum sp. SM1970]|uniref:class I ribonucleotide reductase maintenance protein YfaE n=1 Tax=Marinifaba aquimaris TaxID=2741323 RepID=UPI0015745A2B|nr:class I ribonucleotide reductase maintenance protein YfaE [Marinifaba aquimaris]NTS77936.1 2Fe-2S iron-sulfur cluster binding domain-containing protein [Marinifaba aquimaris]